CEFGGMTDCNSNGVIDLCEPGGAHDCNTNGIPDQCDIFAGRSSDCNSNGTPDECDAAGADFSLAFDGIDDRVRIPRSPLLEPTQEITIEMWVRGNSSGGMHSTLLRMCSDLGSGVILQWQHSGNGFVNFRIECCPRALATDTTPHSSYFG